jgi:predicted glutamine amidotransferase
MASIFSTVSQIDDRVAVIAIQPLADNENLQAMQSGESPVFSDGVVIRQCLGPIVAHPKAADAELSA